MTKKVQVLFAALGMALAGLPSPKVVSVRRNEPEFNFQASTKPGKSKGAKKREASLRKKRGWC